LPSGPRVGRSRTHPPFLYFLQRRDCTDTTILKAFYESRHETHSRPRKIESLCDECSGRGTKRDLSCIVTNSTTRTPASKHRYSGGADPIANSVLLALQGAVRDVSRFRGQDAGAKNTQAAIDDVASARAQDDHISDSEADGSDIDEVAARHADEDDAKPVDESLLDSAIARVLGVGENSAANDNANELGEEQDDDDDDGVGGRGECVDCDFASTPGDMTNHFLAIK